MTKMDAGSAIALGTAVAIIAAYGNSLLRTVNLFANNRYQAAIAAGDKKKAEFLLLRGSSVCSVYRAVRPCLYHDVFWSGSDFQPAGDHA